METGKTVRSLKRTIQFGYDVALAFSADSKLLFSMGGFDGIVRIEDVDSGDELLTQTIPADNGGSLAISPNGKQIAIQTGANSQKVLLWDWQTGQEPRELSVVGRPHGGGEIAFSPRGDVIVWASYNEQPVYVWDAKTGELKKQLSNPEEQEQFNGSLAFSPDGQWMYTPARQNDNDGHLYVWKTATWEVERTIAGKFGSIAITNDGKSLIDSDFLHNTISLFDLATEKTLGPREAHQGPVQLIDASQPDFIATAGDDGTIRLWNPTSGRQTLCLEQGPWIRGMAVSPNGKLLLSSSMKDVYLLELPSGQEVYRFKGHGPLGGRRSVAFSEDGQKICSFGDDFILRVFDVRTGKLKHESRVCIPGEKCQDVDEELKRSEDRFPNLSFGTCFSPHGKWLLIPIGKKMHLYNGFNGKWEKTLELEGEGGELLSTFSPDARQLLVGYYEKRQEPQTDTKWRNQVLVGVLDVETGRMGTKVPVPSDSAYSGCFSADGKRFALHTLNPHRATVYRLDGQVEAVIPDIPARVWRCAFTYDGRSLITSLDDSSVLVWDLAEFTIPKP